jgi:hypothetical protein
MKNSTTEEKNQAPSGHFIAMLQSKTGGVSIPQLDAELAALVRQVRETGRPGRLTYVIKVSRNAKAGVKVEDEVKVALPKLETGVSFYYTDENGALLRNDPNQRELTFAVVAEEKVSAPKVVAEEKVSAPKVVVI